MQSLRGTVALARRDHELHHRLGRQVLHLLPASHEPDTAWHWSDAAQLLAVTDHTQVLRVLNVDGRHAPTTLY